MRIGMIIDAWFPHFGGGQVHAWELSRRLVLNHGCEIDIVTRTLRDEHGVPHVNHETHLDGRLRVWRLGPPQPFEVVTRAARIPGAGVALAC